MAVINALHHSYEVAATLLMPSGATVLSSLCPALTVLLILWQAGTGFGTLSCFGEDGIPVDWWVALKAPGTDRSGNTKYGYVDNSSSLVGGSYAWREASQIAGVSQNPPADTLAPLYNTSDPDVGYVMWNDEPGPSHCPGRGCTSFVLGHSKGVLGLDNSGGFWLSHSVPKYPDSPADAQFGGIRVGQLLNGQSFVCVSLTAEGLESLASLLQISNLDIFSPHTIPAGLQARYPNTYQLATTALNPKGPVDSKAVIDNASLRTAGGEPITVYAKSSTGDNGDSVRMWEDVVEPGLQAGMNVQSWPEGSTKDFPSYCGPPDTDFNSHTITEISIPGTNLAWKTRIGSYRDHSKWGVTEPGSQQAVFCEGDNNRAVHQNQRGGTALCFAGNSALHAAVASIVTDTSPCGTTASNSSVQEQLDV